MNRIKMSGLILLVGVGVVTTAAALAPSGSTHATHRSAAATLGKPLRGTIALSSLGIAELTPDTGPALTALHVRAAIANTDDLHPWAFDVSQARLTIAGQPALEAVAVNSDIATLPITIVSRGERRVIDFYFAVSPELADRIDSASFAWPINAPRSTSRARFDRNVEAQLRIREITPSAGWGQDWWFDPTYPWATYFARPGYAVPRPPKTMTVTRAPTWAVNELGDAEPREHECDQW